MNNDEINLILETNAENEITTDFDYNEKIKTLLVTGHIKNQDDSYTSFIKFFNNQNKLIKTSHDLKRVLCPNSKVISFDDKFLIAKNVSGGNKYAEISLSVINETLNIYLTTNLSKSKDKIDLFLNTLNMDSAIFVCDCTTSTKDIYSFAFNDQLVTKKTIYYPA